MGFDAWGDVTYPVAGDELLFPRADSRAAVCGAAPSPCMYGGVFPTTMEQKAVVAVEKESCSSKQTNKVILGRNK